MAPPIAPTSTRPIPTPKLPPAPQQPKPAVQAKPAGDVFVSDPKAQLSKVEKDLTPTYTVKVDGKDVSADVPLPFRINGGMNQVTPEKAMALQTKAIQKGGAWPKDPKESKALMQAIGRNAYGRPTPAQVKLVTDKLIKAGALEPYLAQVKAESGGKVDGDGLKTAIRRMQWDYGVGADCNGVCQIAYKELNGKAPTKNPGDALIHTGKNGVSLNPNFKKVDFSDAKPGDVIKLDDVGDDFGHNVVVTDSKTVSKADAAKLTGSPAPAGPLKQVTVLSSWGAGGDPDSAKGGLRKETWVYDEGSKKWGTLDGNNVKWSKTDGPYDHKFVGVYRAK